MLMTANKSLRGVLVGILWFAAASPVLAWDDGPGGEEAAAEAGAGDDESVRQAQDAAIQYLNLNSLEGTILAGDRLWVLTDNGLSIGVNVAPLGAALRTQLGLADDRGVVVTHVEPEGPGAEAGIQLHDVLLSIDGEPVTESAGLREMIDAAGEDAVPIVLMRRGRHMSLDLTPSNASAARLESGTDYWIGITAAAADDALRTQLSIPGGRGLVVTEVYDDSAADAAGIEVHDVLLEFGDVPLTSVEELNNRIQEVGGEPAVVQVIRGGDELILRIIPRAREGGDGIQWVYDASESLLNLSDLYTIRGLSVAGGDGALTLEFDEPEPESIEQQLQSLIEEARKLTEQMRSLQESIRPSGEAEPETE